MEEKEKNNYSQSWPTQLNNEKSFIASFQMEPEKSNRAIKYFKKTKENNKTTEFSKYKNKN